MSGTSSGSLLGAGDEPGLLELADHALGVPNIKTFFTSGNFDVSDRGDRGRVHIPFVRRDSHSGEFPEESSTDFVGLFVRNEYPTPFLFMVSSTSTVKRENVVLHVDGTVHVQSQMLDPAKLGFLLCCERLVIVFLSYSLIINYFLFPVPSTGSGTASIIG